MSEPVAAQPVSALGGAAAGDGLAVAIEEVGPIGMIALKGDLASDDMRNAATGVAGVDFPSVREARRVGERGLLWMAPDELLVLAPRAEASSILVTVGETLKDRHHLAADVSDARAMFRLTGDAAREALAKGAPVDLARGSFGPGDLRRTHLGQVAVAFWQTAEGPDVFELVCFRSVAAYVFDWLVASAAADGTPGHL